MYYNNIIINIQLREHTLFDHILCIIFVLNLNIVFTIINIINNIFHLLYTILT